MWATNWDTRHHAGRRLAKSIRAHGLRGLTIEHNRDIISMRSAIPPQPAWAKAFALGVARNAGSRRTLLAVEKDACLPPSIRLSLHNEILQPLLFTVVFYVAMVAWLEFVLLFSYFGAVGELPTHLRQLCLSTMASAPPIARWQL